MKKLIPVLFSAVLLAGFLAGSGGCGGCNDNGGDSTRPTILSVSPSDGATGVPITTTVSATFSEVMNATSINEATFSVEGATGTVSYEGTTATLTPSAALAYNTTFTVTVTTGVKDAADNSMASDYTWSFTTRPPPGTLDATFGTSGTVTTAIGSGNDEIHALGIQEDDGIVVAGQSWTGINFDFGLARYTSIGALDTTFGSAGTVTTAFGTGNDHAEALGIQTDGKIVVAGYASNGANNDFALARYTPTGALDATFGSAGTVTTFFGSGEVRANALGIQSDGKIVAAGYSWNSANYVFTLARYLTDGNLDTATFGSAGTVTTIISTDSFANALGIQADGKIVVGGSSSNGINYTFGLARYNSNGTPDTTFGSSGITTTTIGTDYDTIYALGIQSDGKIVVAGSTYTANFDFVLARYNSNGTLDTTFGSNGITVTVIGMYSSARALRIQSDGKIVAAGYTSNGVNADFALARYNSNGALDATFGTASIVTTVLSSGDDYARALGIQSDGKIVAAGWSLVGTNIDFALARYWP